MSAVGLLDMSTIASLEEKEVSGGEATLVDLLVDPIEADDLRKRAAELPSIRLSQRSVCDLEMLATGGFSPLRTFLGRADLESVCGSMRLADGRLFPIPITLPVDSKVDLKEDKTIALRDVRGEILALMDIGEIYAWNAAEFQAAVFGTTDKKHPLVAESDTWGKVNITGRLRVLSPPKHFDFADLRMTPQVVRDRLAEFGSSPVVAFQTRNPLHRGHEEIIRRALEKTGGVLLLHPAVGMTRPGDVDHVVRINTYRALIEELREYKILLSLLPLAMRMAGPREALWHAVIRRNYGATHLIVGRDHASPGVDSTGESFYPPYAGQQLLAEFGKELGVESIPFEDIVYLPDRDTYSESSNTSPGERVIPLSGSDIRRKYLDQGVSIPEWYMRPRISRILKDAHKTIAGRGVCVWFTGLSGAGKSTTAELLTAMMTENGRSVTLLDGDIVRTNLSEGLGFDRAGRNANIRRIGFVASEIVRHGGIAVCAAISPYRQTRNEVRKMFPVDRFVEVYIDTPLDVCEERDTKGLYQKARRGELANFTGIDDVYEPPDRPEIILDTVADSAAENAEKIFQHLSRLGIVDQPNIDD